MNKKKKILFICGAQKWYPRNEFISNFLRDNYEADIIVFNDKFYFSRIAKAVFKFLLKKNKKEYEFIYAGFPAQPLVPIIRMFYKGRLIGDYFISLYDTLCLDRKKINNKFLRRLVFLFEKRTIKQTDFIITDTRASKDFFVDNFGAEESRIKVVYALADKKKFFPAEAGAKENKNFTVFYYGSGQPLQGIDVILKAAKILEKDDIKFLLVGPIRKKHGELIHSLNLTSVDFIDWVDYGDLPDYIKSADICLGGHFGATAKAERVIAGKTFQFAAMGKPVILGNNKANREIFSNGWDCVMVGMNDEKNLALAIKKLKGDARLREKIAGNIYHTVIKTEENINLVLREEP